MTHLAQMRIGSLEIVTALAAVAVVASRPRAAIASEAGTLAPVKAVLRIFERGRERSFQGVCPLTIGRDKTVDLPIGDAEVSRRHARLETQGETVYLRDLGSSNGTFLNGRRIDSAIETREGDEIDVGITRIVVEKLEPWT
ncbi:MAG TPA: FHA domain-containing protein [Candidatus Aquilonibacter sp.]